jgi:GMP synthase (glutamine-hydrolysing)
MGSPSRERLKIVLFQLRDNEETKKIDYESYLRATGLGREQLRAVDVFAAPPDVSILNGADAIIIGGSKWSVWEDVPNQPALIEVMKAAREKKTPMLGVCFGAQLIAHVFGGQVARDEEHAEWGTFMMETGDEAITDMLLADAPFSFPAMCAHHDRVTKLPPGAVLLASSARCPVQAFAIPGTDIYAFQFHPERSKADYEQLIQMKGKDYSADQSGLDAIKASLKETTAAESLLAKFVDRIVLQRK